MDLKIDYNKDKSHLNATLTVPRARYVTEERMYNTEHVINLLKDIDITVTNEQCISSAKVFNYSKLSECTGTWTFLMAKTKTENKFRSIPVKTEVNRTFSPPARSTKMVRKVRKIQKQKE